ncbi:MAG TPA: hypothetical protein VGC52_05915 [Gemmatimonadaceae bacterium]
MRISVLAISAAALGLIGCVEKSTAPDVPPVIKLSATVTSANSCNVSVADTDYSSLGQIRGDLPKRFVGTVENKSYHGFGCWVATSGGDGDLIVLFAGNNLGKPLAVGTYPLVHEIYDNTPLGVAAVTFRPSYWGGGDRYKTLDTSAGSVVVEDDGNGGLTIRVDAEVARWGSVF